MACMPRMLFRETRVSLVDQRLDLIVERDAPRVDDCDPALLGVRRVWDDAICGAVVVARGRIYQAFEGLLADANVETVRVARGQVAVVFGRVVLVGRDDRREVGPVLL